MAKSKNQRRLERLVAAGGKASMAALVALPIACGDATAPAAKSTSRGAKAAKKADPREELFTRLDAASFDPKTNITLSAGGCGPGGAVSITDIPAGGTGLCASGAAATNKLTVLNVSIGNGNSAPVKVSTRAADGALLVDGKEAIVVEQTGWVVKTYKFKAATTNVVINGGSAQDNVIVDLSSKVGPKTVNFSNLTGDSGWTASDSLFVKGSSSGDAALAQADGSVKFGTTVFFADSKTPASLNLMLGAGDDTYDGSKFVGYKNAAGVHLTYDLPPVFIAGQEGNDTFFSGAAIEWFVGGAGVDTVKSLGFTKNGDIYATSGGLDYAGNPAALGTFDDDTTDARETGWFPDASGNATPGYANLPFYDTLRADVLDLSGWIGATSKLHGASGEDMGGVVGGVRPTVAGGSLFDGNDWLVNDPSFPCRQDIAGLVIDIGNKTNGDDPTAAGEVYLAGWPGGVPGWVGGSTPTYFGLAKLMNETDDTNSATTEEYFSEFRAPRTPVTFWGDLRAEKFVESAVPFADSLNGSVGDSPGKDTISYELRTKPVKVDFTYYGLDGDGGSATWTDATFAAWTDGNHNVPEQDTTSVFNAKPCHGEGYYVGAQQKRVFICVENDNLDGFHNITGGAGNDWLIGSQGPNVLSGGAGNDMIEGYGGTDLISGGPGADLLDGGDRHSSATKLSADFDVVDYSAATAGVNVDLSSMQQTVGVLSGLNDPLATSATTINSKLVVGDGDILWRFEGVKGSAFGDTLRGLATGSVLAGGPGSDTISAAAGSSDLILGGDGDDYLETLEADDAIDAGAGDDLLDSSDATLTADWSSAPLASTTWTGTNQPVADLDALPSVPGNLWVYPRMTDYVSATQTDSSAVSVTTTEHEFTCGSGSDVVSWSQYSSYDSTAAGLKDLYSCNDELPRKP